MRQVIGRDHHPFRLMHVHRIGQEARVHGPRVTAVQQRTRCGSMRGD
jgi:hypothetical protein